MSAFVNAWLNFQICLGPVKIKIFVSKENIKARLHFGGIQLSFQVLFSVLERYQNRQTSTEFEF